MNRLCQKIITGFCLGLAFLLFTALAVHHFTPYKWLYVRGESVDMRFGQYRQYTDGPLPPLYAGQYIVMRWEGVDPNRQPKLKNGMRLVKRVGCAEGQHLQVTPDFVKCNGAIIGMMRTRNLQNQPLTPALFNAPIPEGHAFVMGDHFASYDSRYFGLIKTRWVDGVVTFRL